MITVVLLIGLAQLAFSSLALHPSLIHRKDFIQEYLLARAVLSRTEPYRPLPEMAAEMLGYRGRLVPHPATHPPPMAIITLPLGLLKYEYAATLWFVLEITLLAVSFHLLLQWQAVSSWRVAAVLTLMSFTWSPLVDEVLVGQLNMLLLWLLLLAWLRLREGRELAGGVWLGGALIVKLMAWPIVLFLLLRRNWRALFAAGAVVISGHLIAIALMGWENVLNYYRHVAPTVPPLVRANEGNFSVWSLGWRLFEGTGCEILPSTTAPPLLNAPGVARIVSFVAPLLLLATGLWLARKARSFDAGFAILTCVSVLMNPVVWSHYLVMTIIPAAVVFRRLKAGGLPRWMYWSAFGCGALLFLPRMEMRALMNHFEVSREIRDGNLTIIHVPFAAGLISLIPLLAVLSLMWLVWQLDKFQPEMKKAPACDAASLFPKHYSDEIS
ncbi:MAG: glycosyltransferase family 87 protein [Blastocatellia bacterium]